MDELDRIEETEFVRIVTALSPIKVRAAEMLAAGLPVERIATAVGRSRQQIWRWVTGDVAFRRAVEALEVEMHRARRERLLGLVDQALANTEELLEEGDPVTTNSLLRLIAPHLLAAPASSRGPRVIDVSGRITRTGGEEAASEGEPTDTGVLALPHEDPVQGTEQGEAADHIADDAATSEEEATEVPDQDGKAEVTSEGQPDVPVVAMVPDGAVSNPERGALAGDRV